jgi:hypothetical protein
MCITAKLKLIIKFQHLSLYVAHIGMHIPMYYIIYTDWRCILTLECAFQPICGCVYAELHRPHTQAAAIHSHNAGTRLTGRNGKHTHTFKNIHTH